MIKNYFTFFVIACAIALSGCDQVLSKKEFSQVFGQDLKWDPLPPIDSTNLNNYLASGECISDLRTDVTIFVDEPAVTTATVPCTENKFSATFDFSPFRISIDIVKMRAEHTGYPLEALEDVPHEAAPILALTNTTAVNIALVNQNAASYVIDWGDGTRTSNVSSSDTSFTSKNYGASLFTGFVRIFGLRPSDILELRHTSGRWSYDMNVLPQNLVVYSNESSTNITQGSIANLPLNLTYYRNVGSNRTTGSIESFPAGLVYYSNDGNNTTSGNIGLLPIGIEIYSNLGGNTTSGNIGDLPATIINFRNEGRNTTTGDIANLPSSLVTYRNRGSNTTSGNIADLKPELTSYANHGNNSTTGDIADLQATLVTYDNQGGNTTTGQISSLKPALETYINLGNNTTTGNISEISPTLITYDNRGQNSVIGQVADIPSSVRTYRSGGPAFVTGQTSDLKNGLQTFILENTGTDFTGDIALLPSSLRTFTVSGDNTLFGDIANLQMSSPLTFDVRGNNTISGDISALINFRDFILFGQNTTTGDIALLPASLREFVNGGVNTTFGFINTLKANMRTYKNYGNNLTTANGTSFIPVSFTEFELINDTPRSQVEIDNILGALARVLEWPTNPKRVDLRGLNSSAPGSAGQAAITILTNRECNVFTN